jgi:hypothetical protein
MKPTDESHLKDGEQVTGRVAADKAANLAG